MKTQESRLPSINLRGKDWVELKAWIMGQIQMLQGQIMNTELTHEETAALRGRYQAYQLILGLESRIDAHILRNPQAFD